MYPPEKITVLQMDENGSVVSRTDYAPGEVPQTITPQKNTEYFVVETHKIDGEGKALTSRKLYGKDTEALETFLCREDGICVRRFTVLEWDK
jgi:hypothetical protein